MRGIYDRLVLVVILPIIGGAIAAVKSTIRMAVHVSMVPMLWCTIWYSPDLFVHGLL